jgi:excisionase family DNA binding protein
MTQGEQLLSIAETAVLLGVSAPSVRRRIARGEIRSLQLGGPKSPIRVRSSDLADYLQAHEVSHD